MSTQTLSDNNKEGEKSNIANKGVEAAAIGKKRGLDARTESNKKTSADIYARHKYMHDHHKDYDHENNDDGISYKVEAAKSSRSTCHRSGELIPKGSLRWASYQRGIPINGYVSLQNVTPAMLCEATGVTLNVQGIEDLSTEKDKIEALTILRDIAMRGDEFDKKDGLSMSMAATVLDGKLKKKSLMLDASEGVIDTKCDGSKDGNDDSDNWVDVKQRDVLPSSKGRKEISVKMENEDSGDETTPSKTKSLFSTAAISALTGRSRQKKKEEDKNENDSKNDYVDEVYLPSLSKKRYLQKQEKADDKKEQHRFMHMNNEKDEENNCIHQSDENDYPLQSVRENTFYHNRFPAARDVIVIQNLPDMEEKRVEALCFVESTSLPKAEDNDVISIMVTLSACMEEFIGTKSILLYSNGRYCEKNAADGNIEADNMRWRLMPSQRLVMSKDDCSALSNETGLHENKEQLSTTRHSIKEIQEIGAAEVVTSQKSLEGLRFVATGVTEEYCTIDIFKAYIRGIVEAAGGRMTLKISSRTDYVVAGDWHHDPFRNTIGTIESGSKYQKAMMMKDCTVISIDDLRYMVELGVDEFHKKVSKEQGKESGVDTMQ